MARIFWACWDGGGNLPPGLGVATELGRRGHEVGLWGRPEMVPRARAAGVAAEELVEARTDLDRYSFHPLPTVFGFTSSPAVGEELVDRVARHRPDLVVIDAMFAAALDVAPRFGLPTAVMVHTLFDRLFDGWVDNLRMQSRSREQAGFPPLAEVDRLWGDRDLIQVNALAVLDGPAATDWPQVRHGAPILVGDPRVRPVDLPWPPTDPTPLVLLSFSTVPEQRNVDSLQAALDALAGLPVHVVATTGGVVDPAELRIPPNAFVVEFADHDALLAGAALLVGHGGHGTTMRTLRHGVPLVGMPAKGADQAPITRLLEEWGVGRALPGDATAGQIRQAAEAVLADPGYRDRARAISAAFDGLDGATLAADAVESLLPR